MRALLEFSARLRGSKDTMNIEAKTKSDYFVAETFRFGPNPICAGLMAKPLRRE
jgi:hypothetical protein